MSAQKFSIEVAKYFRDFLETNFHKRKAPKRSFKTRNEKNLLVGVNLRSFEVVRSLVLKSINNSLSEAIIIEKGKYTQGINQTILDLVARYCGSLEPNSLFECEKIIQDSAKNILAKANSENIEQSKEKISELIKNKFSKTYYDPLIELISAPLSKSHHFDEEMTSSLKEELISIIEEKTNAIAAEYIISNIIEKKITILKITDIFSLKNIAHNISTYFNSFKTQDLFYNVNELINNKEILEKQELYLYFFDIKFNAETYPLFYVGLEAKQTKDTVTLVPDNIVYINKKAIDFIIENINQHSEKRGKIKSAEDRIIHLSEPSDSLKSITENLLNEFMNYCQVDGVYDSSKYLLQSFKSNSIGLSNSIYLALFDKSDESLVNDYEELISILGTTGESIGLEFCKLLEGFLKDDPIKIVSSVEKEWENTGVETKLVNVSPIPLNEEQNQIMMALKKENCRYVVVEGPPGTGKSHSITALVFNSILDNKNILVLSDKNEALDVVEDKITETLNSVRLTSDFQNPILRLGKSGNTYNKILSSESLTNIKNHYKVVSKNKSALTKNIELVSSNLKQKIKTEIDEYAEISIKSLIELEKIESQLNQKNLLFIAQDELLMSNGDFIKDLESLYSIGFDISYLIGDQSESNLKKLLQELVDEISKANLNNTLKLFETVKKVPCQAIHLQYFYKIKGLSKDSFPKLKNIIYQLIELGSGIFGYFLKGKQIKQLNAEFQHHFTSPDIINIKTDLTILSEVVKLIEIIESELLSKKLQHSQFKINLYPFVIELSQTELDSEITCIKELLNDFEEISDFISNYPLTSKMLNLTNETSLLTSNLLQTSEDDFELICAYARLKCRIEKSFKNIPQYDYVKNKNTVEQLYTTEMTHILDERVINFAENHSAKAKTLKKIISSKKRFPKEEFQHLKEAFPCIIAGIRDYAEYIPLDQGIFDLVIIDEASQVSIAQALPAILRAKKVVVFGDNKQFSNIKSSQAKSEVNSQYVQNLKTSFLDLNKGSAGELERLSKFNIKTSVLDFFEYISNYNIMLRKHFRGYRELISYSSKYFYQDHLQAIKICGKKIEDVIEFKFISHDGKLDLIENSNSLEVDSIIKFLEQLSTLSMQPSVGIITPHTNQQKLLMDKIHLHPKYDDWHKKNKIKIMTFDTCQGEERDIILYSMVANPSSDKLSYIFIPNLKDINLDEDNKIKAQRLNVGFSRAKEKIVFFLSKPVEEFSGAIGEALRHYANILEKSKKLPELSDLDPQSPMEIKVLNWIQETAFFKTNSDLIELKAQFPIGEYLKQLEPTYTHPKYVCDFLLLMKSDDGRQQSVIIEYDGFKEHFTDLKEVNEYNYRNYYSEDDVFREKVLEGYGYKFLRINKFNYGKDPVETLDIRLKNLINDSSEKTNPAFVKDIQQIIHNLEEGNLKECFRCGKLRPLADFKDNSLVTGIGRSCVSCKGRPTPRKRDRTNSPNTTSSTNIVATPTTSANCPQCKSPMIERSGKYGRFLGCSKFPRCRGTRRI